jgi:plastocyanin
MTTPDENPITRTSPQRMTKGILIVAITLAIGGAIIIPYWQTMIHNAPAAETKKPGAPETETGTQTSINNIEVVKPQAKGNANISAGAAPSGPAATTSPPGGTTSATAGPPGKPLTILAGASVQGSPDFDPDTITVKKGDKITVTNKDTLPHTVTSGTGPSDPNTAKQFDTSIIEAGATADIDTTNINPGQYPFHCTVHPYMTGKLVVQAGPSGPATAAPPAGTTNATAATAGTTNATAATTGTTNASAAPSAGTTNATAAPSAGTTNATAAPSAGTTNATAGAVGKPLTILAGASVQGSPNFDPDTITVKKGDKVTVTNKDSLPHTVTSGTGPTDPNNAKQFDTSIIEAGATADIETTKLDPGQYPFFCTVHPYMTGKLVVQ